MKELLRRVERDSEDHSAREMALMLFRTATLRSGYMLRETADFALSIEHMMRQTLGVPLDEMPEDEDDVLNLQEEDGDAQEDTEDHDEL